MENIEEDDSNNDIRIHIGMDESEGIRLTIGSCRVVTTWEIGDTTGLQDNSSDSDWMHPQSLIQQFRTLIPEIVICAILVSASIQTVQKKTQ